MHKPKEAVLLKSTQRQCTFRAINKEASALVGDF
jgi:hypothetical protein